MAGVLLQFGKQLPMNTDVNIKKVAPYALAAGALTTAGIWLWSKTKTSLADGIVPVANFKAGRYLGEWYEIARFDYRFEKGLENVTAHYSLNKDGSIKVVNRGQDGQTGEWKESTGKAKFVENEYIGRLKVSFFGPFYAAYSVIAVDPDYMYAMVAGNDLDYLWLLSRAPVMPYNIRNEFLRKAASIGYNIGKLVWTKQEEADEVPLATVS